MKKPSWTTTQGAAILKVVCVMAIASSINGSFLGSAMPAIRETFGLNYLMGGQLVTLNSVVSLFTAFLTGYLIEKLGPKAVAIAGILISAVGLAMVGLAPTANVLMIGRAVGGLGGSAIYVASTFMMDRVSTDGRRAQTMYHNSFGVGSMVSPIIVVLALHFSPMTWRTVPLLVAVLQLAIIPFYLKLDIPKESTTQKAAPTGAVPRRSPFRSAQLYLLLLLLMVYMAVETAITTWMVTYLQDTGLLNEWVSQYFMLIFWGVVVVGRTLSLVAGKRFSTEQILAVCCGGLMVFLALFLISHNPLVMVLFLVLMSLFLAPVYPLAVANIGESVGITGRVSSTISIAGGLATTLMPMIVGGVADSVGITEGMWLGVAMAVVTAVVAVVNLVYARKSAARVAPPPCAPGQSAVE